MKVNKRVSKENTSSSIYGESALLGMGAKGRYIPSFNELEKTIEALKTIGARIVLTQGSFDFIHIGHFLYLEKARAMGDVLVVGVDSDSKIRKRKGSDRPVVSEDERVEMLRHVRHVNFVTLKDEGLPKWSLIKTIKPDVLVATKETYKQNQIKQLKKYCGQVIILEPQATTSTTAKLRRLNIGLSNKIRDAVTASLNETFDKLVNDE